MSERVGIVLQARMGSSRLPGKVLKPLAGVPMLERIVARLRTCRRCDVIVLATSDLPGDDPIAAVGTRLGIALFRGSESDVLDRYYRAAKRFELDAIVRTTGDNPFVDPEELDRLVAFRHAGNLDYACAFPEFGGGLPIGVGTEVFTADALARSWRDGHAPNHREHVNEYAQENPDLFAQAVCKPPAEKWAPELSLTVDTPEQFLRADTLQRRHDAENGRDALVTTPWLIAAARDL